MNDDDKALLEALGDARGELPGLTAFLRRNREAVSKKFHGRAMKGEWDLRAERLQERFPKLSGEVLRCSWARVRAEWAKEKASARAPASAPAAGGFGIARPRS